MASALETVYLTGRKDAIFPNIVCVHGFGSQPESTWHHEDTGKTWIKDADFLELLDGSCRVFSYEFNAAISANLSAAGVLFHAHDLLACLDSAINGGNIGPIFFVAHSWGGIVVKKAIHLAWTLSNFKQIKDSLAGLFFLGTPHVYHDMGIILDAVRKTVALHQTEDDEIPESDIRLYAMGVRRINEIFYKCRPAGIFVSSFWEAKPTSLGSENDSMIIPEDCKVSEMEEEFDGTVDCNHADLARFPSTVDLRFRKFISTLNHAIVKTMASEELPIFSSPPKPPSEPADPNKPPPSPPPTPPVEIPSERPSPPKLLFDPKDGPDERIIYWKRRTKEEETHKQRTNFLRSLKGWTEYNTGSHLAVASGTCLWTLEDPAITFWRTDPDCGTMFIMGEAGRGKSYLAKDMTNRLRAAHSKEAVMSFHCTPNERPAVWEYFTWYLISQDLSWFDEVPPQYRTRDVDSPPLSIAAFTEIWNAFRAKPSFRTIWMIIDGLEQCGEDVFEEFFTSIQQLRRPVFMPPRSQIQAREEKRPPPTQMKIAFTSRSTPATDLARSRLTFTYIPSEKVDEDVTTHVKLRFGPLTREKGGELDERTLTMLKDDIVMNAKGYWPYANFALADAEQALLQDKDIEVDSTHHMPVSLRTWLHHKILEKLQEPHPDRLSRMVVTFMACSPFETFFKISVLKDMIRIFLPDDSEGYDLVTALKRDWGEVVGVTSKETPTASFLHESIAHVVGSFLPKGQRHLNNAFVYINYLLNEDFIDPLHLAMASNLDPGISVERFLQDNPFYETAAITLFRDVRASGELGLQLIPFLRAFFDHDCPQYKTWCVWADWRNGWPRGTAHAEPILMHFVSRGCIGILEHFIPSPNPPSSRLWNKQGYFAGLLQQHHEDSFLEIEQWPEISNDEGKTVLMKAILCGKQDVIDFVLQYDPDVNRKSRTGLTPLLACFSSSNMNTGAARRRVIELLLRRGADVHAFETRTGVPVIGHAAELGDVETVRLLLSYGANIHATDSMGISVLERASASGDIATFAEIVDCGADVDTLWYTGDTPLSTCILEDRFEMFNMLLPICDVNKRDSSGLTPLNYACGISGRNEYIRRLLEHPATDVDALEKIPGARVAGYPINPLTRAVYEDNYQAVEMLLHAGANPGRLPGTNASPLFLAIMRKHDDIVKLLLSFNSPVNLYFARSWPCTALGAAVKYENENMVELLLEHGADPTIEDAYDRTGPLAIAATHTGEPNMRIVHMLLSARIPADVNCLYDRCPIITEASEVGNMGLVRLLLDHGADLTAWLEPHMMPSPLVMAAEQGHVEVCEVLLEHEPRILDVQFKELRNCDTPLLAASEAGQVEVVRFLLSKGARPDLVSPVFDRSPLLMACRRGHYACVKILIEAAPGMVNVPDALDCMPWLFACDRGDFKIMKALLDAGADFTRKDRFGNGSVKPEFFAKIERPEKTIELLLEYGFDINEPHDAEGRTVLCFAILDGAVRHVKWLLERGADPMRCQKSLWKDDTWRNALIPAMNSSDPEILELFLEPKWGLLEHLKDVDELGENVLSFGSHKARMFEAIEAYGSKTGEDLLSVLLSQADIYGLTATDKALGDVTLRPEARPAVIALLVEKINKVLNLSAYDHNEHQELVSTIGYDLLHLGGHDAAATCILSLAIVSPKLGRGVDRKDDSNLTAWRSCVACDEDIVGISLACRFCWRLRCFDCKQELEGSGAHMCDMVEVPLVIQEGYDLKETLRAVAAVLQTPEPLAEIREEEAIQLSPEETHLQSTLQLAVLHAFNYLAIRRPLFTPYLELAPSVEELMAPWRDMISEERRYWETDNMIFEIHPVRLREEMRHMNRRLGRAYVDADNIGLELVLGDIERLFEVEETEDDGGSVTEIYD